MDKSILTQYADIKRESYDLQERIDRAQYELDKMTDEDGAPEMTSDIVQSGDIVTGRTRIYGISDLYVRRQSALRNLKAQYELKQVELLYQQSEAERFIETIPDSRTQSIVRMRVIDRRSWQEIATRMGGGNTADGVRKVFDRYIERTI